MSLHVDAFAVANLECPYCLAPPERPCTVRGTGTRARFTHEARSWPVRKLWRSGFLEGVREGAYDLERRLTRPGDDQWNRALANEAAAARRASSSSARLWS